jgi:hypothetical protein
MQYFQDDAGKTRRRTKYRKRIASSGTEAGHVNSAESGLPGPTIDARGALLYIATPALSPCLSVSPSRLHHCARGGHPFARLLARSPHPYSTFIPDRTGSTDFPCATGFPASMPAPGAPRTKRYPCANKDPFPRDGIIASRYRVLPLTRYRASPAQNPRD